MAVVASGIVAFYPPFVYYSGVLMTEGMFLVTAVWALANTVILAEEPTGWRWGLWGLAVGLTVLLRQVFMPMAGLLLLYVLWKSSWRVHWRGLALAGGSEDVRKHEVRLAAPIRSHKGGPLARIEPTALVHIGPEGFSLLGAHHENVRQHAVPRWG